MPPSPCGYKFVEPPAILRMTRLPGSARAYPANSDHIIVIVVVVFKPVWLAQGLHGYPPSPRG